VVNKHLVTTEKGRGRASRVAGLQGRARACSPPLCRSIGGMGGSAAWRRWRGPWGPDRARFRRASKSTRGSALGSAHPSWWGGDIVGMKRRLQGASYGDRIETGRSGVVGESVALTRRVSAAGMDEECGWMRGGGRQWPVVATTHHGGRTEGGGTRSLLLSRIGGFLGSAPTPHSTGLDAHRARRDHGHSRAIARCTSSAVPPRTGARR